MYSGKGLLILGDGRKLPLSYRFGAGASELRSGQLHLDTSSLDPASYSGPLRLTCEDGANLELLVMQYSDRHLSVTGRLVAAGA
jgi:hypothetical protein